MTNNFEVKIRDNEVKNHESELSKTKQINIR